MLDAAIGPISDPVDLLDRLLHRAGVVEVGLFLGLATDVYVAHPDGVEHLTRATAEPRHDRQSDHDEGGEHHRTRHHDLDRPDHSRP